MSGSLQAKVDALPWYHTLDLPGATTKGMYDLRTVVSKVLPDDLSGLRCLDAATASGFWAFEMEKRGASEVVAIDLDELADRDWQLPWQAPDREIPMVESFTLAKESLGSNVKRVECSLYDITPERLEGTFDFVFIGSVLLHLRDPVKAMRALRTVTGGRLRSYEVNLFWASLLSRNPRGSLAVQTDDRWWTPNAAAHRRWLVAAGFDIVDSSPLTFQPFGRPKRDVLNPKTLRHPLRSRMGEHLFGVPTRWLEARPAV